MCIRDSLSSKLVLDAFAAQAPFDLTKERTWSALNNPASDLWTLHTDSNLAVALWLGFDDPASIPKPELLENGASALITALARIAKTQAEEKEAEEKAQR